MPLVSAIPASVDAWDEPVQLNPKNIHQAIFTSTKSIVLVALVPADIVVVPRRIERMTFGANWTTVVLTVLATIELVFHVAVTVVELVNCILENICALVLLPAV